MTTTTERRFDRKLLAFVLLLLAPAQAPAQRPPIIDMHLHAAGNASGRADRRIRLPGNSHLGLPRSTCANAWP
jgi:hypothetical protein